MLPITPVTSMIVKYEVSQIPNSDDKMCSAIIEPEYVAHQNYMPKYNSVLMQNNPKQLLDSLSPEETQVAAQLMRIQILVNDQKDKFKSMIRPLVHKETTLAQPHTRAVFWDCFKGAIYECREEFEALAEEHGSNQNLRPYFVSLAKAMNKIHTKYVSTYGYSLPCGSARLEQPEYQALKKHFVFIPEAWKACPDTHTKIQPDFFSKPVSYEQAACYLKFLVQIKTHEADMEQEFNKIQEFSPQIFEQIYFDYFPEHSPQNVQFYIEGKECLAPEQSLGVCFEPAWADKPHVFQWNNMGKIMSFLPIVGKEWKFVLLEGNKIVRWENSGNRRYDQKVFAAIHLKDVHFG